MANPSRYTDTTNAAIRFDSSWKARITCGTPGAKNDDASGVMNVTAPSAAMMDHFFFAGQLSGLAGSSGPSQSITLGSCPPLAQLRRHLVCAHQCVLTVLGFVRLSLRPRRMCRHLSHAGMLRWPSHPGPVLPVKGWRMLMVLP